MSIPTTQTRPSQEFKNIGKHKLNNRKTSTLT